MSIFNREETSPLDPLIDALQDEMHSVGVYSDEYPALLTRMERLYEIKAKERRDPINRNTIVTVAGNLLGILTIVAYEQKHLMNPKAFTQIMKPKL